MSMTTAKRMRKGGNEAEEAETRFIASIDQ
jgi:hypothetical protein